LDEERAVEAGPQTAMSGARSEATSKGDWLIA
jgi:hypothetical protein